MHLIGKLISHSAPREINGTQGPTQLVDCVISSGSDNVLCTAFDKIAEKISKGDYDGKRLISAQLSASIRTTQEGKSFQSIRVVEIDVLFDDEPQTF